MLKNRKLPNEREEIILMLLVRGERYGREIRDEYEKRAGTTMPLGSLYTTLDRMEEKGFLDTREGEPNPAAGGNRRKFYKISAPGMKALNALRGLGGLTELKGAPTNA